MIKQSPYPSHRYVWRFVFWLLVIIPFLPEIIIVVTATVAEIMGWDQKGACTFYSQPLTKIITFALEAGASWILDFVGNDTMRLNEFYAGVCALLCLCLIMACLGWASTRSRLLLGFAVTIAFAILPYFGPMLAIAGLTNDNCRPNDARVGACLMLGGYIGNAHDSPVHDAVIMGRLGWDGIRLAFGIFVVYAIVVIAFWVNSRNRTRAARR
jgi:hypothetical protein